MPLTMPQPDFEPRLAQHLRAFQFPTEVEAVPYRAGQGPDANDAVPSGSERELRAVQLLMVDDGNRR